MSAISNTTPVILALSTELLMLCSKFVLALNLRKLPLMPTMLTGDCAAAVEAAITTKANKTIQSVVYSLRLSIIAYRYLN